MQQVVAFVERHPDFATQVKHYVTTEVPALIRKQKRLFAENEAQFAQVKQQAAEKAQRFANVSAALAAKCKTVSGAGDFLDKTLTSVLISKLAPKASLDQYASGDQDLSTADKSKVSYSFCWKA